MRCVIRYPTGGTASRRANVCSPVLQPRINETPRRVALKYAIIALPKPARAEMRAWLLERAAETSAAPAPPHVATWRDVIIAAYTVIDATDRAWITQWARTWIDTDGDLAIPKPHHGLSGQYPAAIDFGRRIR
jgi:hypothetical protein